MCVPSEPSTTIPDCQVLLQFSAVAYGSLLNAVLLCRDLHPVFQRLPYLPRPIWYRATNILAELDVPNQPNYAVTSPIPTWQFPKVTYIANILYLAHSVEREGSVSIFTNGSRQMRVFMGYTHGD